MEANLPRVRLGLERVGRMSLRPARYWFAIHEETGALLMAEEGGASRRRYALSGFGSGSALRIKLWIARGGRPAFKAISDPCCSMRSRAG